MAIPIGTTSRQVEGLARWTLASVVVFGALAWWPVDYLTWGAAALSLLAVLALWLTWRTVAAERSVPGHPVLWTLLGPGAVLAWHYIAGGHATGEAAAEAPGSILNSMVFQLFLLAGGIVLVRSLLSGAVANGPLLSLCGGAIVAGSAAAMAWGQAPARTSLGLLALSGVAVWFTPTCGLRGRQRGDSAFRLARIATAGVAAIAVAVVSPRAAALGAAATALVCLPAGVIFHQHRRWVLAGGAVLAAGAGAIALVRPGWFVPSPMPVGPLGLGAEAFSQADGLAAPARASGLAILGATTGWVGVLWLVGGLAGVGVRLLAHARRQADRPRAVAWTVAAALAVAALLAPGGLFVPSVTIVAAFVLALLPAMIAGRVRPRPGLLLVAGFVVMTLALGLTRGGGIASYAAGALGADDTVLHAIGGFVLALMLAWQMGCRRALWGVVGVVLAAAAGGAGEVLQVFADRNVQWSDFAAHVCGSAAALVPYLLAVGSRWCESPDARTGLPAT